MIATKSTPVSIPITAIVDVVPNMKAKLRAWAKSAGVTLGKNPVEWEIDKYEDHNLLWVVWYADETSSAFPVQVYDLLKAAEKADKNDFAFSQVIVAYDETAEDGDVLADTRVIGYDVEKEMLNLQVDYAL